MANGSFQFIGTLLNATVPRIGYAIVAAIRWAKLGQITHPLLLAISSLQPILYALTAYGLGTAVENGRVRVILCADRPSSRPICKRCDL